MVERKEKENEQQEKKDRLLKDIGPTERNTGVEILLARMNAQPEEFMVWEDGCAGVGSGKWAGYIDAIIAAYHGPSPKDASLGTQHSLPALFLPREDIVELYEKLCSLQGDAFSEDVIKKVLQEESDHENSKLVDAYFHTDLPVRGNPTGQSGASPTRVRKK